jgi:hypothetical protein
MSVYRKDYIFWGWKLDKSEWSRNISTLENWEEVNPSSHCEVLIDQMAGQYIIFGQVLERTENDYEPMWEYTPLYLSYLISQLELVSEFTLAFGTKPKTEPKLFIFTHIW